MSKESCKKPKSGIWLEIPSEFWPPELADVVGDNPMEAEFVSTVSPNRQVIPMRKSEKHRRLTNLKPKRNHQSVICAEGGWRRAASGGLLSTEQVFPESIPWEQESGIERSMENNDHDRQSNIFGVSEDDFEAELGNEDDLDQFHKWIQQEAWSFLTNNDVEEVSPLNLSAQGSVFEIADIVQPSVLLLWESPVEEMETSGLGHWTSKSMFEDPVLDLKTAEMPGSEVGKGMNHGKQVATSSRVVGAINIVEQSMQDPNNKENDSDNTENSDATVIEEEEHPPKDFIASTTPTPSLVPTLAAPLAAPAPSLQPLPPLQRSLKSSQPHHSIPQDLVLVQQTIETLEGLLHDRTVDLVFCGRLVAMLAFLQLFLAIGPRDGGWKKASLAAAVSAGSGPWVAKQL
ncbi:hypothetical protein M407DRAFT_30143 [Tulasnella calospora MUT 4182]|uniref:Uncharacterized protein n=1 Tax=Tulasnella calospora MUT 4182 TaxID=1051891 RepID=A0A0C3Q8R0_9AGAM|nr:hypothetical protein M407DRAFT_30143 [Tulasnella calospora MUT 4182]